MTIAKIRSFRDFYPYLMSENYKIRMLGEYEELCYRYLKLKGLIIKYMDGTLDFEPTCPIELLKAQLEAMSKYKEILEKRAEIEGINLPEVQLYE